MKLPKTMRIEFYSTDLDAEDIDNLLWLWDNTNYQTIWIEANVIDCRIVTTGS